ncbi:MAG: NAD(+)/NADH kinase [Armatimonadetes bacterium]|nr:NAD(+)/NADH kinase [Armatimonadota bacterium]
MGNSLSSIGLYARGVSEEALAVGRQLCAALAARSVAVRLHRVLAECNPEAPAGDLDFVLGADLVMVLGGDGALLGVARQAALKGTPVLGVDVGSFGFLADEKPGPVIERLDDLLAGRYAVEERMMLEVEVRRGEEVVERHLALNDAVVARQAYRHLARLHCEVDGHYLATFTADGVIVSTPTGSTAYNLSAGGPIVDPRVDCIVVAAICPHTLYSRPVVIDAGAEIQLWLEPRPGRDDEVGLTVDGLPPRPLAEDEFVVVRRAGCRARLAHLCGINFFDRLRHKLNWGAAR